VLCFISQMLALHTYAADHPAALQFRATDQYPGGLLDIEIRRCVVTRRGNLADQFQV
jgi:hypothetical protein